MEMFLSICSGVALDKITHYCLMLLILKEHSHLVLFDPHILSEMVHADVTISRAGRCSGSFI